MNGTDSNYDCSVKDWIIINIMSDQAECQVLYGIVVLDKKERFEKDFYVFTTPIITFNQETCLVTTQNTKYLLIGEGTAKQYTVAQAILLREFGVIS